MIQFLAGAKGVGKTKRLLNMVNQSVKTTDGDLVYIDDDKRHIYDLHYDIRFVETGSYPLTDCNVFIGFICGVLSQNSDIKEIYVDGLTNIIGNIDDANLSDFTGKLDILSKQNNVNFIVTINWEEEKLPEDVKRLLI